MAPSRPFSSVGSTTFAPAGVSAFSGPSLRLQPSARDGGIRLHVRMPLCSIAQPDGTYTYGGMRMRTSNNYVSVAAEAPVRTIGLGPLTGIGMLDVAAITRRDVYTLADSPLLEILSAAFSRYRMCSDLTLHYLPETTTAESVAFALAFSDDVYNPQIGVAAWTNPNNTEQYPSFATCKSTTNSVVFASWAQWSRTFKVSRTDEFYTWSEIYPFLGDHGWNTYAFSDEQRLNFFGCLSVVCNSRSAGAAVVKGQLYVEYTIELYDLSPIAAAIGTPFALLNYITKNGKLMEYAKGIEPPDPPDPPESADGKEEKKTDERYVVLDPPPVPASAVPLRVALPPGVRTVTAGSLLGSRPKG